VSEPAETLYLNLTYRCNSRCLFCAADVKYKPNARAISISELLKIVGDKKYIRIDLSGGEPTLHPEILEVVRICREHSGDVAILTHGRRLQSLAFSESLLAVGATFFIIPLYGANAAQHDFVSHIRGSFRQTVAGFQNLQRLSSSYEFGVELKLLLTKYTATLNRDIYRFAKDSFPAGFSQISICPLIYSHSTMDYREDFAAPFEDLKDCFFELIQEIRADNAYSIRTSEFPPCFFPEELRQFAHPNLHRNRVATIPSYADEHSSGLVPLQNAAKQFRGSVFGNQLVQVCRRCRYDGYCAGRPSPYFSATYLQHTGEREFHPTRLA
jgi:MoaA/NifB/PqqE/SkfB family radical SAM enzyme